MCLPACESRPKGGRTRRFAPTFFQPIRQSFGAVKGEDRPGTRLGVEAVGKAGFNSGRLVGKGERLIPGGESSRQAFAVTIGLDLHPGQGDADLLCFDHAGGAAIDVEEVVGKTITGGKGEFAQGNATTGMNIRRLDILNQPPDRNEEGIDLKARDRFRCRGQVVLRMIGAATSLTK